MAVVFSNFTRRASSFFARIYNLVRVTCTLFSCWLVWKHDRGPPIGNHWGLRYSGWYYFPTESSYNNVYCVSPTVVVVLARPTKCLHRRVVKYTPSPRVPTLVARVIPRGNYNANNYAQWWVKHAVRTPTISYVHISSLFHNYMFVNVLSIFSSLQSVTVY